MWICFSCLGLFVLVQMHPIPELYQCRIYGALRTTLAHWRHLQIQRKKWYCVWGGWSQRTEWTKNYTIRGIRTGRINGELSYPVTRSSLRINTDSHIRFLRWLPHALICDQWYKSWWLILSHRTEFIALNITFGSKCTCYWSRRFSRVGRGSTWWRGGNNYVHLSARYVSATKDSHQLFWHETYCIRFSCDTCKIMYLALCRTAQKVSKQQDVTTTNGVSQHCTAAMDKK